MKFTQSHEEPPAGAVVTWPGRRGEERLVHEPIPGSDEEWVFHFEDGDRIRYRFSDTIRDYLQAKDEVEVQLS